MAKQRVEFTIRLLKEDHERLKAVAAADDRSMGYVVRRGILAEIQRRELHREGMVQSPVYRALNVDQRRAVLERVIAGVQGIEG